MTYQQIKNIRVPCKRKIWTEQFCVFNGRGDINLVTYDPLNPSKYSHFDYISIFPSHEDRAANDWITTLNSTEQEIADKVITNILFVEQAVKMAEIQQMQSNVVGLGTILVFIVFLIVIFSWIF